MTKDYLRNAKRRFFQYVVVRGSCMIWIGGTNRAGYGTFHFDGKMRLAHRVAWFFVNSRWPKEGKNLDHLCRVHPCVNEEHLEEVTQQENVLRGEGTAAKNFRRMRCVRGHFLVEGNLRKRPDGGRRCRVCTIARCKTVRETRPEKVKAYHAKYRSKNAASIKRRAAEFKKRNPTKFAEYNRVYRARLKERAYVGTN